MPTTPRKPASGSADASATTKRPRHTRTLAERAQEALDVAERAFTKLDGDVTRLTSELDAAVSARDLAKARRDFLASDPALKPVSTVKVTDIGGGFREEPDPS